MTEWVPPLVLLICIVGAMAGVVHIIDNAQATAEQDNRTKYVDPTVERIVDCDGGVVVYRATVNTGGMDAVLLDETDLNRSEVCP